MKFFVVEDLFYLLLNRTDELCVFVYENQQNIYSNTFKREVKKIIKANSKENLIEKTTTAGEYIKNANAYQNAFRIY